MQTSMFTLSLFRGNAAFPVLGLDGVVDPSSTPTAPSSSSATSASVAKAARTTRKEPELDSLLEEILPQSCFISFLGNTGYRDKFLTEVKKNVFGFAERDELSSCGRSIREEGEAEAIVARCKSLFASKGV